MTVPVRLRITVALVIMAGLALAGAGLVVYAVEAPRRDQDVNSDIEQEVAEFDRLVTRGDPETGEPFRSPDRLMQSTLERNVPSENEFIVAFWDGQARLFLGEEKYRHLAEDPTLVAAVDRLTETGGFDDIEIAGHDYRLAVKAARSQTLTGAVAFIYDVEEEKSNLRGLMGTYALVAGLALSVVAIAAYLVAGRLLRPVRDLRNAAQDISESDLTRRIEATGNDDLTDLTVTFNDMLDRLDDAFSTQRQLLDDVGHELKTPITIVRGHLELTDAHDPAEVEATRTLLLDELDRMARLVEDLILLAKSRRPGFLRRDHTDVAELTGALIGKMRGLAKRDWRLDEQATGLVYVDSQRITQAALQLASNAVRHTHESDVIALGTRQDEGTFSLWVRDTGPGVPPERQAVIFERFKRGTHVGEGSGLGLSIVTAIAEAHGGSVSVESPPGSGATFTIRLPREEPHQTW